MRRSRGRKRRRRGGRGGGGEEEEEEGRKRKGGGGKEEENSDKMMNVCVKITLISVSWLGLHFLSKVIPQTLINVLLTVTFRLKNLLFRTVSTIPVAYCIPMLVL